MLPPFQTPFLLPCPNVQCTEDTNHGQATLGHRAESRTSTARSSLPASRAAVRRAPAEGQGRSDRTRPSGVGRGTPTAAVAPRARPRGQTPPGVTPHANLKLSGKNVFNNNIRGTIDKILLSRLAFVLHHQ